MLFGEKVPLSLKTRLMLAVTGAAGAGILFTYSIVKLNMGSLAYEEAGGQIYARLKIAAAEINSAISADVEHARQMAARREIRETLSGRADPAAVRQALAAAAEKVPGLTALSASFPNGTRAGAFLKEPGAVLTAESESRSPGGGETYVSPPVKYKGRLAYEVSVPVPAVSGAGLAGTLHCRFAGVNLPKVHAYGTGRMAALLVGKRKDKKIVIAGGEGAAAEAGLDSPAAAPLLPAMQGREGYGLLENDGAPSLYAYSRLPAADWLIAADSGGFARDLSSAGNMLRKTRLEAFALFGLLVLAAFVAVRLMTSPIAESAGTAAALLDEFNIPLRTGETLYTETEVIDKALNEAFTLIKKREESRIELKKETEKLLEEEEDLKYQNLELEKLNKYLLERESKISELKSEVRELQEKMETAKKD